MNQISSASDIKTMTSREIATLTGKLHKNVIRDIDKMRNDLEAIGSNLSQCLKTASYVDSSGRTYSMYQLDKEMTMTLITGYSIPLRHAVIRRWQQLEGTEEKKYALDVVPKFKADAAFLECAASVLNLSPSGRLQGMHYIANKHGMDSKLLPEYVDDGQKPAHSATELLRTNGINIRTADFNKLLESYGLISQLSRKSTSKKAINGVKLYWNITKKGERFGKNLSHEKTAGRETQPFWYDDEFSDLLATVGLR